MIKEIPTVTHYNDVTRVEVVDDDGRVYVRTGVTLARVAIQDNGRTLKLFVTKKPPEELIF